MMRRLFPTAKRAFSPPRVMWLGLLLACFGWLMQLSPLFAPLWLDNLTLGHGICVKLAPIIQAGELVGGAASLHPAHPSNHPSPPTGNSTDISHSHQLHTDHLLYQLMADKSPTTDSTDTDNPYSHTCDIGVGL